MDNKLKIFSEKLAEILKEAEISNALLLTDSSCLVMSGDVEFIINTLTHTLIEVLEFPEESVLTFMRDNLSEKTSG